MNKFNLEKRLSLKTIDSTFDRLRELQILLKKAFLSYNNISFVDFNA